MSTEKRPLRHSSNSVCALVNDRPTGHKPTGDHVMDKESIKGAGQKIKGKIEEVAGKVLGDKELELHGKADQLGGAVRSAVGEAKDTIKDAIKDAKKV